jgi:RNA polymerase sigma factor for flagellar operon FliA
VRAKVASVQTLRQRAKRDLLVVAHLDLVRAIAARLHVTLPPCFELDDLIGAGMLGLLEAADQFDPGRGVPFGAFARKRIKGEMMDSIGLTNSSSETRRTTRSNKWAESTRPPILEHCAEPEQGGSTEARQTPDLRSRTESRTERRQGEDFLNQLIGALPRRQAVVITLHYGPDEIDLKRIAHTHGIDVGAARVSQLHSAALGALRKEARLRGYKKAA